MKLFFPALLIEANHSSIALIAVTCVVLTYEAAFIESTPYILSKKNVVLLLPHLVARQNNNKPMRGLMEVLGLLK